jgi:ribonucleoside-triphosphate reductase
MSVRHVEDHIMRLTDGFLEHYQTEVPKWGFNGLGEVVYHRTYSRPLPDGTSEQWWQTIKRVVEGVYEVQKDHCNKNGLPWNAQKAQRSAQTMYDLIFNFKFLPPGRGLWAMGTDYVRTRGSAALNNCFAGDECIITDEGVHSLFDLCDKNIRVFSVDGFRAATVRSFGTQQLNNIRFVPWNMRSNYHVDIRATADHTWILRDGTRTTHLSIGDIVLAHPVTVIPPINNTAFSHGLIFGDGTRHTYYPERHMIKICASKCMTVSELTHLMSTVPGWVSTRQYTDGRPVVTIIRKKENWKDLPTTNDLNYMYWFLRGWIEADAWTKPTGIVALDTTRVDGVEWLYKYAAALGFIITGHSENNHPTNYGERNYPLHRVSLCSQPVAFRVHSIEQGLFESVYCAVQPETQTLALASGITTGNCAFISTTDIKHNFAHPFVWLMDMSMLGVGVGSDTLGAGTVTLVEPSVGEVHVVEDSREGWVESTRVLLDSYVGKEKGPAYFDYSQVRKAGEVLHGFGGVSAGPEPLMALHSSLYMLLGARVGSKIESSDIVDIFNYIGKAVVAGGIRRTAEIMLGDAYDQSFLELKDPALHPLELQSHRWASNNSVVAAVGTDYKSFVERIMANGEPGFFWPENAKQRRRFKDTVGEWDPHVVGVNPCGEIPLESGEFCNLVEVYPAHHDKLEDFQQTLKFAYLYAKSVSLIPTHDLYTNSIIGRNRRLGISVSGVTQALQKFGAHYFFATLLDKGYDYLRRIDVAYSRWLCIPQSIKLTTVKPSGTVSLLAGATPGVHFPHSEYYIRNVRFLPTSPLLSTLKKAGYPCVPSQQDDSTLVVSFPVHEEYYTKGKSDVTMWEQLELAAQMQYWWADNSVSVTITVANHEAKDMARALSMYENRLKSVSLLPLTDHGYVQAPYQECSQEEYEKLMKKIKPLTFKEGGAHDITEVGCTNDSCSII